MPPYRYTSLDPEAKTIRLVTLLPSVFDDDVHVSLQTTVLDWQRVPTYEALSYAWGSTEQPSEIKVARHQEDQPLMKLSEVSTASVYDDLAVTRNLGEALRYLRWKEEARVLWIDAICVNQQDLQERGDQVQRMADIYGSAQRVIVWLSPTGYRTSLAMETIGFISSQIEFDEMHTVMRPVDGADTQWADEDIALPFDAETWRSIHSLVSSGWFKRLCIWQEVMLARSVEMQCGEKALEWGVLRKAIFCMRSKDLRHPNEPGGVSREICYLLDQANDLTSWQKWDLSLFDALKATENCKFTDPRDKIYALLNIIDPDSSIVGLKPDYTQTSRSVYQDTVLRYLDYDRSLNLTAFRDWDLDEVDKPTWVSDFSKPSNGCAKYWNYQWRSCWGSKAEGEYMGQGLLRVTGVYCAKIHNVEKIPLDHTKPSFVQILRRLARNIDLDAPYVDGSRMSEAFGRMLCMDSWADDIIPTSPYYPDRSSTLEMVRYILEASESRLASLSDDVTSNTGFWNFATIMAEGRSFITTEEGYISLAPESAKAGDEACIILGCPSILILRPNIHGRHTMVGKSYVQGLMDGSALLGPLPFEWQYKRRTSDREINHGWINQQTEEFVDEDPRLGQIPFPWRLEVSDNIFVNNETGDTAPRHHDPRLSAEALRKRGVPLRDFILE
ncbi:MAG: hypothetical protein Q9221_005526 [Calogaya cf. arnoldii]